MNTILKNEPMESKMDAENLFTEWKIVGMMPSDLEMVFSVGKKHPRGKFGSDDCGHVNPG